MLAINLSLALEGKAERNLPLQRGQTAPSQDGSVLRQTAGPELLFAFP